MFPKILCFLDVETTGMRPSRDRIIEIGILRVENGKQTKVFQSLINPGQYIPPEITVLTGITAHDLENAPVFWQIKDQIKEILDGAVLVAHNARFDYSFLRNEFRRLEESFKQRYFCSVKLVRKLFPGWEHHNLDSVITNLNIECKRRHRAFDDAKVLSIFLEKIQELFPEEKLKEAIDFVYKRPSLPLNLKPEMIEDLPESPGVYIFYGQSGAPLYVGKSINLRDRVLSHFTGDLRISGQIASIETIKTAGELSALIKESQLIKDLQPLYNRKLRVSKKPVVLKRYQSDSGYFEIIKEEVDFIESSQIEDILGVFKSKRQANDMLVKLAKEKNLCGKLLGLEKVNGSCFGSRLGRCFGACLGKENFRKYNLRFLEAFMQTKIKQWPFKGKIKIYERNELEEKEESFIVDKWCFIDQYFDLDTYKILERYLRLGKGVVYSNL